MLRKAVSVDDAAHRFDPSGTANKSVSCGYPERVRMGECHGRNSKQRVSLCGGQGFGFGTAVGGRGQFVRVCRQAVRAPTVTETKKITGQKNEGRRRSKEESETGRSTTHKQSVPGEKKGLRCNVEKEGRVGESKWFRKVRRLSRMFVHRQS